MRDCPEGNVTASGTSSHRCPIAARIGVEVINTKRDATCTGVLAVVNQLQATAREVPLDIAGHWTWSGSRPNGCVHQRRDTDRSRAGTTARTVVMGLSVFRQWIDRVVIVTDSVINRYRPAQWP
jgi:hypothetical protein